MNTEVARMKKAGRDDKRVPEFRECGVGETFPFECATTRDFRTPFSPQRGEGAGMRGITIVSRAPTQRTSDSYHPSFRLQE